MKAPGKAVLVPTVAVALAVLPGVSRASAASPATGLAAPLLMAPREDPRDISDEASQPGVTGEATSAPTVVVPPKTDPPPSDKPPPAPDPTPTTNPETNPRDPVVPPVIVPPDVEPATGDPTDPSSSGTSGGTTRPQLTPTTTPTLTPIKGTTQPGDRTQKCLPARGRCRRLAIAGITTASVGVAMLATGIGFITADEQPIEEEPVFNRSLAPPGKALLGFGVGAIFAGGVLVLAGVARHREWQRGASARVRMAPGGIALRW